MAADPARRRKRITHETAVLRLALGVGLPALLISLGWLWLEPHPMRVRITLTLLIAGFWLFGALALRERVVRPLQTLSNLIGAVREGDYATRARDAGENDALGLAYLEINSLADALREQRMRAIEADALLRRVTEEIDVAVFAFDARDTLRLVNRAGERALGRAAAALIGETSASLGLAEALTGSSPRLVELMLPQARGRWEARHGAFRLGGHPHTLLVLTDVSRTLRAEERTAWQRLVRVLGHEINNSLAPIKSLAGSLRTIVDRRARPDDWESDLRNALGVIEGRAEALQRFMAAYAALARLPEPRPGSVDVAQWVGRVAALETRMAVRVRTGPVARVAADSDQLDQLLINLVRNAVDAALETGGGVEVTWQTRDGTIEVRVDDEGPGLSGTANLFTPFFTTKPGGSGIGLALSRQIAEAHGGALTLEPRAATGGATARLILPAAG